MKKSIVTGFLCLVLTLGVFGKTAFAEPTPTPEPTATPIAQEKASLEEEKTSAVEQLGAKYTLIKNSTSVKKTDKSKAKGIYSTYKNKINNCKTVDGVSEYLNTAITLLDAMLSGEDGANDSSSDTETSTAPTSSSDLIMVGGNWVTPTAYYGRPVNVVLPIVNMMKGINLANVIVTPVTEIATTEWPFEIETSGYTQTIADLPGAGNGQDDMTRRRELTWTFRVRDDVMNGYYKVPFLVNYIDPTTGENTQVTLTTYVQCVGAPGSGNVSEEGKYSTPRVIVSGYDTVPEQVHAGDVFKLVLHLKNTSVNTSVSNMLVNLVAPNEGTDNETSYSAFMPSSGSNSFYVEKIAKGGTTDLEIEMKAKNDLSQKPYALDLTMEYEDENINSYTASADVSIQVYQDARFEFSTPEIMPQSISVGDQANIMFSIYNTGRVALYNAHLTIEGDAIESEEVYLGNIEAGATGNVDTMLTGMAPSEPGVMSKLVLTYEDENQNKQTYEQEIEITVMDMPMYEEPIYDEGEFAEEESGTKPWVIVLIIAGVIAAIVVAIIVIKKVIAKKKQKEDEDELWEDLSELEAKKAEETTEGKEE